MLEQDFESGLFKLVAKARGRVGWLPQSCDTPVLYGEVELEGKRYTLQFSEDIESYYERGE